MKWKETEPDLEFRALTDIFKEYGLTKGIFFLQSSINKLLICRKSCWDKMIAHIKPHSVEMGGLLLGSIFRDNHKTITTLEEVVPSRDHESSSVSLRMESSVWSDASKNLKKGQAIVGWYHSHPNLGSFFSGTDRQNQQANFRADFHVGLVIDPVRNNELAIFRGPNSEDVDLNNFILMDQ